MERIVEMFLNYSFAIGFFTGFLTGVINMWATKKIFIKSLNVKNKQNYIIWWFLKFSLLIGFLLILILLVKINVLGIFLGLILAQIILRFKLVNDKKM